MSTVGLRTKLEAVTEQKNLLFEKKLEISEGSPQRRAV